VDIYSRLNKLYKTSGLTEENNTKNSDDINIIAKNLEGKLRETEDGPVIEISSRLDYDERHGSFNIRNALDNKFILYEILFNETGSGMPDPEDFVFIDTETTGLSGGSGTMAFQIGIGFLRGNSFIIKQFFCPDFDYESSMLKLLNSEIDGFGNIVTYNGKCYDIPLLENRMILNRIKPRFSSKSHLDMLTASRRLWKNRYGDCSLTAIEKAILNFNRTGDIPGYMIPQAYFDYLHSRHPAAMRLVLAHNRFDILSLAGIFYHGCGIEPEHIDSPEEQFSMGKIFLNAGEESKALKSFLKAGQYGPQSTVYNDSIIFIGAISKRNSEWEQAYNYYTEALTNGGNPLVFAIEAAKISEHRFHDYEKALNFSELALQTAVNVSKPQYSVQNEIKNIRHRKKRLLRKLSKLKKS